MTTQGDVIRDREINHSRVRDLPMSAIMQPMAEFLAEMDALIKVPRSSDGRLATAREQEAME